jgi:hypothetical protein
MRSQCYQVDHYHVEIRTDTGIAKLFFRKSNSAKFMDILVRYSRWQACCGRVAQLNGTGTVSDIYIIRRHPLRRLELYQ